jgi:CubicO group peptidase (beta-lactamase class C family)
MFIRVGLRGGLLAFSSIALAGCAMARPDELLDVVSGMNSHILCSETFVSGLPPEASYTSVMKPQRGFNLVHPLLGYEVDRERNEVRTSIAGLFRSRAVYREGWGCTLARGDRLDLAPFPADVSRERKSGAASLPDIAGPGLVEPASPELRSVLDTAFAERPDGPPQNTRAVVVVHHGKVIAERYAPGYGIHTSLHGWSMVKSVFNGITGLMVRDGLVKMDETGLMPAWRSPADPRHAVTIDHLLRQTSGLDLQQTNSGFDPASRMKFVQGDMAGYAEQYPLAVAPGTRWDYSDANYVLLARVLRDRLGGPAGMARYVQKELFTPLGIREATLEVDTTGTPIASAFMFAPARDWARFGMLYLNDGVVGGKRLLPEGWVRASTAPFPGIGYGAGLFTNDAHGGQIANWGIGWGMPKAPPDAFWALGYMGQYTVVVPSERLVVVRMGPSRIRGGGIEEMGQLVAGVVAAVQQRGGGPAPGLAGQK